MTGINATPPFTQPSNLLETTVTTHPTCAFPGPIHNYFLERIAKKSKGENAICTPLQAIEKARRFSEKLVAGCASELGLDSSITEELVFNGLNPAKNRTVVQEAQSDLNLKGKKPSNFMPKLLAFLANREPNPNLAKQAQTLLSQAFRKPTVAEECARTGQQIRHVLQASYEMHQSASHASACASETNAPEVASPTRLLTWAARDNDRSSVKLGDQCRAMLEQIDHTCSGYRELLDKALASPSAEPSASKRNGFIGIDSVISLPQSVADQFSDGLQKVDQILQRARAASLLPQNLSAYAHSSSSFSNDEAHLRAIQEFFAKPENDLNAIELHLLGLCKSHAHHPLCATFHQHRLSGFAGEARINGAALGNSASPADAQRLQQVVDEIAALHQSYPDCASIVIADFSDLNQVETLRSSMNSAAQAVSQGKLNSASSSSTVTRRAVDLSSIPIIPLLEDAAAVKHFVNHAEDFNAAGISIVMLAGSDLVRAAGTAQSIILRHQFNEVCQRLNFDPYHGIGMHTRRNGAGFTSDTSAKALERLFYPAPYDHTGAYRHTLQGGQASIELGNSRLAQRFLEQRQKLIPARANDASPNMYKAREAAEQLFQPLIEAEHAMRDPQGEFAQFYQRNPIIGMLRNISTFHGSRDKTKSPANLYDDRAIQVDASQGNFSLDASFAWKHLAQKMQASSTGQSDPSAWHDWIEQINQALQAGNPVVQDIVRNYALQAVNLTFSDQCEAKWAAAKFSDADQQALRDSREFFLEFLSKLNFNLAGNSSLLTQVLDYLSIQPSTPTHNGFQVTDSEDFTAKLASIETQQQRSTQGVLRAIKLGHLLLEEKKADSQSHTRQLAQLALSDSYVNGTGAKS